MVAKMSPNHDVEFILKIINKKTGQFAAINKMDVIEYLRTLDDNSIDLIVTDPAYSGMNQHLMLGKGRIVGTYKDRDDKEGKKIIKLF